jgi:catechol 2,3-dioxygenase
LALQAVGDDAPAPRRGGIGLYHTAFEVSDEDHLREAYRRATELELDPAAVDHGISWAIYLRDPDGNGVEVYCDRRQSDEGSELWDGRTDRIQHRLQPKAC